MKRLLHQCAPVGSGVVGAQVPEAVDAGRRALEAGGNAYDAVLAAAFVETVCLPPKCGLAGDLVALVHERAHPAPEALVAVGPAPAGLAAVAMPGPLPLTGGTSVGVPAAPAGYAALAERARLPVAALVAPAVDLARTGVRVGPVLARLTSMSADLLRRYQPDGCVYLPDGRPVGEGDVVRLPGLATVLETFRDQRAGAFHGPLGDALVNSVRADGGVLDRDDLHAAEAQWSPVPWRRRGRIDLAITPAPTYGPLLSCSLSHLARGCGEHEAVAAAMAARDELAADGGTSIVAAADAEGTSVVLVHSNSFPEYGSGIVVAGFDLVVGNRAGRGFRALPGSPGGPAPGRRPPTTLHAWAVRGEGGGVALGATSGGENQVVWNAQLLGPTVVTGRVTGSEFAAAMERPRWAQTPGGGVIAEAGALPSDDARAELVDAVGSSHVVVGTDRSGVWAVADPRQTAGVTAAVPA